MNGIRLCATGSYLPDHVVTNDDFTKIVETSDEWIRTRTGIATRHIADGDATWSMGVKAAKRALEAGGISPEEIDLVLVPGLCYDRQGYRLGFGGGYYDRWLAGFPGLRVGLCREAVLQDRLPVEHHDLPVDLVVTESECLSCSFR